MNGSPQIFIDSRWRSWIQDGYEGAGKHLSEFQGANLSNSSIPGIAIRTQAMKKLSQPRYSTNKPDGDENTSLPNAMKLVNSAYCVAVNFLFVMLAIKATNAAVPMPALKFSKPMTETSIGMLWPTNAKTANPAVDIACKNPKTHKDRLIPKRSMTMPPRDAPVMIAQDPRSFVITPISVNEKPISI